MSRGALKELLLSSEIQFRNLVKDVPASEKNEIVKILKNYVSVLGVSN